MNQNFAEYNGYKASFHSNNDKNNLYYTIKSVTLSNKSFLIIYIYTNINEARQNLYLKLLSAISNIQISLIIEKNTNHPS